MADRQNQRTRGMSSNSFPLKSSGFFWFVCFTDVWYWEWNTLPFYKYCVFPKLCVARNLLFRHVWHSWKGAVRLLWAVWPQTRTNPKAPSYPQRLWPPCWLACSLVLGKTISGLIFLFFLLMFKESGVNLESWTFLNPKLCFNLMLFRPCMTANHAGHLFIPCYLSETSFVYFLSSGVCPRSCQRPSLPWLPTAAMWWAKPGSRHQGSCQRVVPQAPAAWMPSLLYRYLQANFEPFYYATHLFHHILSAILPQPQCLFSLFSR